MILKNGILRFKNKIYYSIRYRILLLVALGMLIPIILFATYMYTYIYHNILEQHINSNMHKATDYIDSSIVSCFRVIENTQNVFLANQEIRDNLNDIQTKDDTYYLRAKSRLNIETQLKYSVQNDYGWNNNLIQSVFVFLDKDDYYYLLHTYLPDDEIVSDHIDFYNSANKTIQQDTQIDYSHKYDSIYFKRDIYNLVTNKKLGQLVIGVNNHEIQKLLDRVVIDESIIILLGKDGTIYFHNDSSKIGNMADKEIQSTVGMDQVEEITYNNQPYYVYVKNIPDLDLYTVMLIPTSKFYFSITSIIPEYLYLILFTAVLSIVISVSLIAITTLPIEELKKNIDDVREGTFNAKMPPYRYTELNEVSVAFNQMIDQIQYLFNEVYEKQILVSQAEIKALQAQINPHFLFNVLETISWEARMSGNETIYNMVNSLGQLLRASLTFNSGDTIKLRDELEYVNFYIYLQRIRFGDRLNININIDNDKLLNCKLPKLSLQPIVENAIVHGLEQKVGQGNLDVNIYEANDCMMIDVIDNGIGFDTEGLESKNKRGNSRHVGIYNVKKRIKLIYGADYGMTIKSTVDAGTKVTIKLPFDGGGLSVQGNDC